MDRVVVVFESHQAMVGNYFLGPAFIGTDDFELDPPWLSTRNKQLSINDSI